MTSINIAWGKSSSLPWKINRSQGRLYTLCNKVTLNNNLPLLERGISLSKSFTGNLYRKCWHWIPNANQSCFRKGKFLGDWGGQETSQLHIRNWKDCSWERVFHPWRTWLTCITHLPQMNSALQRKIETDCVTWKLLCAEKS